MVLEELALLLQTAGIGMSGSTLFKHALPADGPVAAQALPQVALIEIGGLAPVRTLEMPPSRYEQPVVSVVTRGAPHGYQAARQKAQDAWEVLDGVANQTLSGVRYLWIQALRSPFWVRDDPLGRPIIVFDIRIARAL